MIRILILSLISFCFTALSIYANCDLPTGGACSIEDLKQKQNESQTVLPESNSVEQLMKSTDEETKINEKNIIKKDLPKQEFLEKLYDLDFDN